jgi:hypothetical protein
MGKHGEMVIFPLEINIILKFDYQLKQACTLVIATLFNLHTSYLKVF